MRLAREAFVRSLSGSGQGCMYVGRGWEVLLHVFRVLRRYGELVPLLLLAMWWWAGGIGDKDVIVGM